VPGEPCQIASPIVEDNIPLFIECLVPGTPVLQHYSTFLENSFPGYRRLYELTVDLKQTRESTPLKRARCRWFCEFATGRSFLSRPHCVARKNMATLTRCLLAIVFVRKSQAHLGTSRWALDEIVVKVKTRQLTIPNVSRLGCTIEK